MKKNLFRQALDSYARLNWGTLHLGATLCPLQTLLTNWLGSRVLIKSLMPLCTNIKSSIITERYTYKGILPFMKTQWSIPHSKMYYLTKIKSTESCHPTCSRLLTHQTKHGINTYPNVSSRACDLKKEDQSWTYEKDAEMCDTSYIDGLITAYMGMGLTKRLSMIPSRCVLNVKPSFLSP